MKKYLALAFVLAALLALATLAAPAANAGTVAGCWSDPSEGPAGTVFNLHCAGFEPNAMVWPYLVEPDGATSSFCAFTDVNVASANECQFKVDQDGLISFPLSTKSPYSAPAFGTWTLVVEQLGPGHTVIWHAEGKFTITGKAESVSGAHVWASTDTALKNERITIYGHGFEPFEVVTIWFEYPNGDCSSLTEHWPPYVNFPRFFGYATNWLTNVKTDAAGEFASTGSLPTLLCEGKYHFVARGNTSDNGGETWVTLVGNAVETNAWLKADKSSVSAIGEHISFSGWGFGAYESVTCWLTTPQYQAMEVYNLPELKTDAGGEFSFHTWTGGFEPGYLYFSEGPVGKYAMTCRGNVSGATAIAEFMVNGNVLDP